MNTKPTSGARTSVRALLILSSFILHPSSFLAAQTKITELPAASSLSATDLIPVVVDVSGTATTKKGTITVLDTLLSSTSNTLTNKTFDLGSNTLTATSAQLLTAVSDETGTGLLVFGTSPTILGNLTFGGGASASEFRFMEPSGSGSNYTAFKAQAQSGTVTYTLPSADGTSGQVLSTNGSGTMSWGGAGKAPYTYLISQNAGGTVYTAYDDTGAVVTSSSTPDIVPVLNTLLANLVTAGKGGKIFIKSGSYIATDAGGWTDDPNDNTGGAAYLIGVPVVDDADQFMPIEIEGEGLGAWGGIYTRFDLGGAGALNTVGTQIKCVLSNTTLPNKSCSLFRVLTSPAAASHFYRINYVRITLGGIRFTAGTTPLVSGGGLCQWTTVHTGYASGLTIKGGLLCDVQHDNTSSTYSKAPATFSLGGVGSTGFLSPNGGNQAAMQMDYLQAVSYNIGVRLYDHTQLQMLYSQNCQYGAKIGSGTDHIVVIEHYLFQQCNHAISFDGPGRTAFKIGVLDGEPPDNLVDPQGRNFWGIFHDPTAGAVTGELNILWGTDGYNIWNANGNTIGFGTLPGAIGGASEDSNLRIHLVGNFGFNLTGTTAGKIRWSQPEMGTNYKKVVATLQGYDNNTGTAQTITFKVPFLLAPVITQPSGFGATATTTTLTLPTAIGAAVDGVIVIEGR